MLFPYGTDAPIYHYPIATVVLIAVNVMVFFAMLTGAMDGQTAISLILEYGHINPLQWITSNFVHADIIHLLGNMFFLWGFGLVIEGKLGWYRFVLIYLGIGIVQCALEQTVTLGMEGGSLGASAILFGLLAMAWIWAPKNEMNCFLWLGFVPRTVEVPITTFALIYLGMQIFFFVAGGFAVGSSALHLMGVAVGVPVAIVMLKMDWVDCEGWDLFSVIRGKTGRDAVAARSVKRTKHNDDDDEKQCTIEEERQAALKLLREHLREGRPKVALAIYQKMVGNDGSPWELPEAETMALINGLHREQLWSDSIPLLVQVLKRFSDRAVPARLMLAQILVQAEERPNQALAVLAKLPDQLPPQLAQRRRQIEKLAQAAIDDGAVEFDMQDW